MELQSARAPGRVELLGNHTDYNEGYVLSAAIDRDVTMRGERQPGGAISLRSITMDRAVSKNLDSISRSPEEPWADYPLGVVEIFRREGFGLGGFSAVIDSTLPLGAGLSSSAALEVATAMLLKKLFDLPIDPLPLARLCRRAENEFVGVNCGLLDQVSSVFGKKDHAIFLDCRKETVATIPFPPGLALLITDSGVKHALIGGEYNDRRAQCFEAAAHFQVAALRDVTTAELQSSKEAMPWLSYLRALHITGENERVLAGVELLRDADATGFGELMFASHESSRVNFENSTPELDAIVKIARQQPAVLGSRLTGGGFGGATVSLIQRTAAAELSATFAREYLAVTGQRCRTYLCEIADGAA